ncbi:endonuclease [Hyalangium rubrum]|uniref:Endonuclease n=1 Tax=Hyalangium rubrum TaxID=3103134 RepID=A0ABU5HBK6_9BACT|nr:endonuclease [Hyalangium sp. s54d21]MDY7230187.1 endonuclease [Hyalangium sp. s54d21]
MGYVKREETPPRKDGTGYAAGLGMGAERGNGHGRGVEVPVPPAKATGGPRTAEGWYQRVHEQLEQAERRYRERSPVRETVLHQLEDEGLTPIEVDSPERVHARMKRLGIEGVERGEPRIDTASLRTKIVPATAEPAQLVYERVLGRSDLTSVCFLERGLKVSRSVGRVHIGDSRGRVVGYGTGFLVSPRLMLTNNHVLRTAAEAGNSRIEFNYQSGLDGGALPSVVFALDPAALFLTDVKLDYTLVAVKPESLTGMSLSEFGFTRLIEAQGKVLLGEYVNIIQHPNGEPKQLALRENQVVDLLDDFCHYLTDTAPGSSGSPVYNDQWEVVALHHMGVPKRTEDGRLLTLEGETWEPGMDPALLDWKANEGTRVSSLVRHVRAQTLSAAASKLRAELLEPMGISEASARARPSSRKRPVESTVSRRKTGKKPNGQQERMESQASEPMMDEEPTGAEPLSEGRQEQARAEDGPRIIASPEAGEGRVILTDGGATLTLPLRLSIQIGLAGVTAPAREGTGEPGLIVSAQDVLKRRPAKAARARTGSELMLEAALGELERSRSRPYFDEAAARVARERYYETLGEEPDYAALSELVRGTHRTLVRYAPMREVYPWVELYPDGLLRSIYSGKEYEPEDFIREDARIDEARAARFREVLGTESALGAEAMTAELELLEAALPYNCEHVVPQSWFAKREPMRGDLHHLFACESGCNSFRGNTPYFDFPDFEEALREECGKRVGNKFEPTRGKGTVARATLYFLLRYPGEINRTSTEYDESRLELLLNWHQEDPPALYERHRNEAIFERQGNRNPFIDHPEWAELVDFSEGLG